MALIFGPTPDRREFLRTAVLSAGAAFASGCARIRLPGGKPPRPSRWALLADTHVSLDPKEVQRGQIIDDNFKTAVAQIVEASPEAAVIVGDVARLEGRPGDYDMVKQLMEPMSSRMPVALILGNHDHRENFFKAFPQRPGKAAPVKAKHVVVIESADLRFLMLDSLFLVNQVAGLLGKDQRTWLAKFLDQSDRRPTFLFFHHDLRDSDSSLLDGDRLLNIVLPRKQVKALFYGHTHVYRYDRIKGLHLVNLPAVGYAFGDKEPLGWVEARFTRDGGEFTLRAFAGNKANNGKTTSLDWRG